ncbi:VWA domain-containing protein [Aliiroseovarius sp. 2305UL8-7]|uniref:VWA domain-containing protein n=1 Tax=Aliiroseovarius conchicola TaxID=3121637 RepID=UPI003527DDE4
MNFADFHFLRPEWLWAFAPAILLGWLVMRNRNTGASEGWAKLIDSHLLAHLAISGTEAKRSRVTPVVASLMVVATVLAMAGPTWEENEVPSFESGEPVVAVLSLAQSMNSDDLTPTRLKRSVHKLRDVLGRTQGDERGLVIYSDAPFVAAPLTSDPKVIEQMLPELSTNLMPVLGNRLDLAITEAQDMLARAGATRGEIIVMADNAGDDADASIAAARAAYRAGYSVSVLGAGTEEGATLQTSDGRAIASHSGETLVTKLSKSELQDIAQAGGGVFSMVTPGNADLDRILPDTGLDQVSAGDQQDFNADTWVDMGYWLLLIPALFAPFAFRRGLVFALALMASGFAMQPKAAQAGIWDDLWATPNQQGQAAFEAGAYLDAATLFEAPNWQATAAYRAGDYATATEGFANDDYNLGNALAKSGQFEAALAAYDKALVVDPGNEDAQFNRDLIADLLEQQEQQEQDQQQEQQQQDQQQQGGGQDQEQNQSSGGDQSQDQQSGGEQSQDQQSGGEQSQDQQSEGEQSQDQQSGDDPSDAQQASDGQQGAEGQQDQQQAGQQDQDAQSEADQAEADDTGTQDEQSASEQANGEDEAPQPGVDASQDANGAEAGQNDPSAAEEGEEEGLAEMLSDALSGGSDDEAGEMVEGSSPGAEPLNQAVEQQLRRVPDDPSGLLRARIRQHYARQVGSGS